MTDTATIAKASVRAMNDARNFPDGTCPASRHVAMMAEALAKGQPYAMLTEEPQHCAISLAATVEALWKARADRAAMEAFYAAAALLTRETGVPHEVITKSANRRKGRKHHE